MWLGVRVSTVEQNEARQIEALEKKSIEKWFVEKSAARIRTDLQLLVPLLDYVREKEIRYTYMIFLVLLEVMKDLLSIL